MLRTPFTEATNLAHFTDFPPHILTIFFPTSYLTFCISNFQHAGKSQCPYPGDPPNGLIAPLKFHYDPGDFLTVQCRPGFVEYGVNGPPERPRCLPDGNWSGPVPQCRNYEEV